MACGPSKILKNKTYVIKVFEGPLVRGLNFLININNLSTVECKVSEFCRHVIDILENILSINMGGGGVPMRCIIESKLERILRR